MFPIPGLFRLTQCLPVPSVLFQMARLYSFCLNNACVFLCLFISRWALKSFSSLSAMNSVVQFMYLFSILRTGKCISHQVREEPPYRFLLLTYKLTFSTTVCKDSLLSPCTCSVGPYVVLILSGIKDCFIAALRCLSS